MSPTTTTERAQYRVRYLGPWTWVDDMDGWAWPRRRYGWRAIVTSGGRRLDVQGTLLDVVRAAVDWPDSVGEAAPPPTCELSERCPSTCGTVAPTGVINIDGSPRFGQPAQQYGRPISQPGEPPPAPARSRHDPPDPGP